MDETIKQLVNTALNTNIKEDLGSLKTLLVTFIILSAINIFSLIGNWLIQRNLKNTDFKIINHNLRETERMRIINELYKKLNQLTYYLNPNEYNHYLHKNNEIKKYLSENKLFINDKYISVCEDFDSYFSSVLTNFNNKDVGKELQLLNKFSKIFNE